MKLILLDMFTTLNRISLLHHQLTIKPYSKNYQATKIYFKCHAGIEDIKSRPFDLNKAEFSGRDYNQHVQKSFPRKHCLKVKATSWTSLGGFGSPTALWSLLACVAALGKVCSLATMANMQAKTLYG